MHPSLEKSLAPSGEPSLANYYSLPRISCRGLPRSSNRAPRRQSSPRHVAYRSVASSGGRNNFIRWALLVETNERCKLKSLVMVDKEVGGLDGSYILKYMERLARTD